MAPAYCPHLGDGRALPVASALVRFYQLPSLRTTAFGTLDGTGDCGQ